MNTSTHNINRRILLAISILFFGISSSYAQFKMGNTLTPLTGNLYPIILSNDALGGLHQVATIAARNAIPALRRQQGMLCAVLDAGSGTPKTYQLIGGILDANWVEFTSGATTVETDPIVKAINGIVKSNGSIISAALAGTDYLSPTGSAATLTNFPILNQNTTGNAATVTTNANLTGEVTSVGNAATLTNDAVIGKILTGYVSGAGIIDATDNILQAIQKLNGNNATNANMTGDVTSVGNATTIAPNAVNYGKMQTVTASRLLGNPLAATATPSEISIGSGLSLSTGGVLTASGNGGTVTSASVVTANGVSGSVATASTTPAITLTLGAITPISVAASGNLSGTQLASTVATGTAPLVVTSTTPVANLSIGGNASTVTTNANLTGEVTSVGNAATITNAAVIGKVLTGYTSGAGIIDATDNILTAIQKLNGNVAVGANSAWNLAGNAGTTPGTNFIGTTDNVDVAFKRNGVQSGLLNSTNTSFGVLALNPVTTGTNNVATGSMALTANTTGNNNTATGSGALSSNVAGSGGVAIGYYSQQYANNKTFAWPNKNTSVGAQSLQGSTTASANTGNGNTALGYQTLMNNTSGNSNVATGNNALQSNTTGGFNTAIGTSALFVNLSGIYNTALGGLAGYGDGATAAQQSIIDNNATFVGYQASRDIVANTTALSNITAIGYMAKVSQNNSLILGGTGANAVSVGIGNTAPDASAVLDVTSTAKGGLLPRMTTAQKNAIATPATGLIVYDNTLNQLQVYDGTTWSVMNYVHPTGDGNLHVPATGTTNSGKVLTAGTTAGSLSWLTPTTGTVTGVTGTAPIVSSGGTAPAISISAATTSTAGSMSSADKLKLDGIASGATANTGTVTSASITTANGISGTVATNTTTPAITLTLGAITPASVAATGGLSGTQITSTIATGTAPLVITSTTSVANLSIGGNAATATNATNAANTTVVDDNSTSAAYYPTWVTTNTGNAPQKVSSTKMTFNPSSGVLTTAGGFAKTGGTASQFLKANGTVDATVYLSTASSWNISGNAGTTAGTNFIGTTDDKDVVFKRAGVQAGLLNSALSSTSWGVGALNASNTGYSNTAIGTSSLSNNSTGSNNVAIGTYALTQNATGNDNIAIGSTSNSGLMGTYSTSNNITIGSGTWVPDRNADNQVVIGNSSITYAGIQVAWTITSDSRWKDSIRTLPYGLNMVNKLRPVDYVRKNNKVKTRETGFIAQDVEKVLNDLGYTKQGMLIKDDRGFMSLRYNDFIPVLTKAIQEQQEQIEKLKVKADKVDDLQKQINELKELMKTHDIH